MSRIRTVNSMHLKSEKMDLRIIWFCCSLFEIWEFDMHDRFADFSGGYTGCAAQKCSAMRFRGLNESRPPLFAFSSHNSSFTPYSHLLPFSISAPPPSAALKFQNPRYHSHFHSKAHMSRISHSIILLTVIYGMFGVLEREVRWEGDER